MSKQEKDLVSCPYCGAVGFGEEEERLRSPQPPMVTLQLFVLAVLRDQ